MRWDEEEGALKVGACRGGGQYGGALGGGSEASANVPSPLPACDLRAPDSQKVLKHAGVLTLQTHTHTHMPAHKHVLCSNTHTDAGVLP